MPSEGNSCAEYGPQDVLCCAVLRFTDTFPVKGPSLSHQFETHSEASTYLQHALVTNNYDQPLFGHLLRQSDNKAEDSSLYNEKSYLDFFSQKRTKLTWNTTTLS